MKFSKKFLQETVYGDTDAEVVEDKIIDHRRWSLDYEMVFKHKGRYYRTYYSKGATEIQDESPFENEPDEIEVPEVVRIRKVSHVWVEKK